MLKSEEPTKSTGSKIKKKQVWLHQTKKPIREMQGKATMQYHLTTQWGRLSRLLAIYISSLEKRLFKPFACF